MHTKKRGKWRRVEEQLTETQRQTITDMLVEGYTISAIMERFGLTDKEQVVKAYNTGKLASVGKYDKTRFVISLRTTFAEVARDHVWGPGRRAHLDNQ